MNKKRIMALIVCVALIVTSMPMSVFAWKAQTHNYIANLILEEVKSKKGKVGIEPFGDFTVAPEFLKALTDYPEAYRAGSLGPDAYPDIYIGQTYIHPKEEMTSGQWLRAMCEDALALPKDDPERYRIIAFILGFMTHYSGDMFGHNYINQIAGGAYPAMTDLAKPDKAEAALSIILKHLSSEALIDNAIPVNYKRGEAVKIDAPNEFILNSLIYDGAKNNGLSKKYNPKNVPVHLDYLVKLRSFVYKKAEYYRAFENAKNAADYAENTLICNYLDRWIADMDRAMAAWIQVSENVNKALVSDGAQSDLVIIQNEITLWFDSYGKYITPAPDVIIQAIGAPESVAKFLKDELGIDYFINLFEEFKKEIQGMIINYMIYNVAGMNEEQVQQMKEALKAPNLFLGEEVVASMKEEMKSFGSSEKLTAEQQEFAPFYNSLVMTKLILIGPSGFDKLVRKFDRKASEQYKKSQAAPKVNNLNVTIRTKDGIEWNYEKVFGKKIRTTPKGDQYGTDDDIYFGVRFKDGTSVEKLFDKSGKNDFEAGNTDTYNIGLNRNVKLADIASVYLRKKSIGLPSPDWYPEYMDISANNGNVIIKNLGRININQWIKGQPTVPFTVNYQDDTYATDLNTGIIDFMESLDNSLQWQFDANLLWKNETLRQEVFYKIFKDVEKYDDPEYLKSMNLVKGSGSAAAPAASTAARSVSIYKKDARAIKNVTFAISFDYNGEGYYSGIALGDFNNIKTIELKLNNSGKHNGTVYMGNYLSVVDSKSGSPRIVIKNSIGELAKANAVLNFYIDGQKHIVYPKFGSFNTELTFDLDAAGGQYSDVSKTWFGDFLKPRK